MFFRLSVGRERPAVRRHVGRTRTPLGKPFRPCAVSGGLRRGERSCAGQILSLVRRVGRPSLRGVFLRGQILSLERRVGRPSPWGVFLRGANPFARAPCRDAFVEESIPARGKSCPPPRAIGIPPRGARRHAGGVGSARGLGGRSDPRVGLPKALLQQPQRLCLVATRQDAGTGVEHLILRVRAASRGAGVEFLG